MNDRVTMFALAAMTAAYFGFWSSGAVPAGVAQLAFFVSALGAMVSAVLAAGDDASAGTRAVFTH
jgi:hypothetical protein